MAEPLYQAPREVPTSRPLLSCFPDLSRIETLEQSLRLPGFDSDSAFTLGTSLRSRLRTLYPHSPALISIALSSGQVLFLCSTSPGVTPDNHVWVARKMRTVSRFGVSSWYMGIKFAGDEAAFAAKYGLGESAGEYAIHGGAVPIRVRGVEGPVGVLVVSGLKQDEDHMAAVEALTALREDLDKE
ncbi:MAG: hypothetical protein MMC23_004123 [Stictis urceolatum]|nr:hypothetical protein [Stictis urceolata]